MGKTKTAFVGEVAENKKSSEQKYKEKKEKQAAVKQAQEGEPKKVHISGLKGGQRIKVIQTDLPESKEPSESTTSGVTPASKKLKIRSKKYNEAKKKVDASKLFAIKEAVELVKESSYSNFDGTVELHLTVKKQGAQAKVALPHSAGKQKRVVIASEAIIKELAEGKINFDVLLATPEMMPKLVPFAKTLGPKGLMPNPKNGTIVKDAKGAKEFSQNAINLKTEKEQPLIHVSVGKVSQKSTELIENILAITNALGGPKQVVRGFVKATMSPAVKIQV